MLVNADKSAHSRRITSFFPRKRFMCLMTMPETLWYFTFENRKQEEIELKNGRKKIEVLQFAIVVFVQFIPQYILFFFVTSCVWIWQHCALEMYARIPTIPTHAIIFLYYILIMLDGELSSNLFMLALYRYIRVVRRHCGNNSISFFFLFSSSLFLVKWPITPNAYILKCT